MARRKSFFQQIIDLPKTAYRIVETPSIEERILWAIVKTILALMFIGGKMRRKRPFPALPKIGLHNAWKRWAAWAKSQSARYQLAGILLSIFAAIVAEGIFTTLFSPLVPTIAVAG